MSAVRLHAQVEQPGTRARRLNSIQNKLLWLLLLAVALTAGLVSVSLLRSARHQMRADLSTHLAQIASLTAMQIDGDDHATLRDQSQQFTPPYDAIRSTLQAIVASDHRLRYAYTLRAVPEGGVCFVVDADTDTQSMGNLGETYDDASMFLLSHAHVLDAPMVDDQFYTDKWGTFLSGYAPIRCSNGSVDGLVGIDIEASWILAHERTMIMLAGGSAALAVLPVLILGVIASRRLARPVLELHEAVRDIASGNLDARAKGSAVASRDEIGDLARAFNRMTIDLRGHITMLAEEQAARRKIERDLELARSIQIGLLPKEQPDLPGFEIAGWNQPADQTGGDYFDWLKLPDGRTLVMLADVTGHGIGPALIVAACRAYIRAAAITCAVAGAKGEDSAQTLSNILSRVNNLLHQDVPDMRFVTAAVCIIDPRNHHMSLASAGHAPLIYYSSGSRNVTVWNADDVPLAIFGDTHYPPPRDIIWHSGDMLVLVTDGFFEWSNPDGVQFGTDRLRQFVIDHARLAPSEFINALYDAVLRHAEGTSQADDLTAVVLRKT